MTKGTTELEGFVNLVLRNLQKNGFPDKTVSFPLEKMYESASQRGFSFNKVRDILHEQGIATELTEERVIFSSPSVADEADDDIDMSAMAAAAQQMMQQMSPEQLSQIQKMMQDMDPSQLESIKQQWEAMPSDEKMRMMEEMRKVPPQP